MSAEGVWHFLQWLHYLALSLWTGGIVFLAGVTAPVAHRSMASRAVAGEIVSKSLRVLNRIEMVCCMVLIGTTFSSFRFVQMNREWLVALAMAFAFMGTVTCFYSFYLAPRMESMKENPAAHSLPEGSAVKTEFDKMHKIYVRLMSLNLVMGLGALYASVVIFQ